MTDFIYLIGPIAWVGGIEYFFLVYGIGTLGYLAYTIVSFLRHQYFNQRFGGPGC